MLTFRVPPFYSLIVRTLTILEGLALFVDPDFRLIKVAIAARVYCLGLLLHVGVLAYVAHHFLILEVLRKGRGVLRCRALSC